VQRAVRRAVRLNGSGVISTDTILTTEYSRL
jgi:hypothetical protein